MEQTDPPIDPTLGTTLAGRFEIRERLAEGTMGRVYLAIQRPIGRRVALKIMHVRGDAHRLDDFSKRFTQEASVLGQLEHPNTVRLYDYGVDGDRFFLAMEFVDGPTLHHRMRSGPLDPLRAFDIVRQICSALDEAHGKGIVHRDLKPSNVLLASAAGRDFVKVVDFGLVKVQDVNSELTQPGLVMGTPNYMAPEQIQGAAVDHRVDLYALGVILYAMLTGTKPWVTDTSASILTAHLTRPPRPLREAAPDLDLPPCVEWTVMRCLEKSPTQRFLDVRELATALNGCEAAVRYPHLRDLRLGWDRGRTVLPDSLLAANGTFSGLHPIHFVPATESTATRAVRGGLLAVIGLGVLAIGALALSGRLGGGAEPPERVEVMVVPAIPATPAPAVPAALPPPEPELPIEPEPAVEVPAPVVAPAPAPVRPRTPRPTPRPAPAPAAAPRPAPAPAPVAAPAPAAARTGPEGSDLRDPFRDQR